MDRPVHISNICHVVELDGRKKASRAIVVTNDSEDKVS